MSLSPSHAKEGFALTEFKFRVMLIAIGVLTCKWMQASALIAETDINRFRQAVAIAEAQSDYTLGIPFAALAPTDGFQRANWISQPGYETGEIPVPVSIDGKSEKPVVYTVSYRSRNADEGGHLRRIAIRVEWDRAGQTRGAYTLEGIRAG